MKNARHLDSIRYSQVYIDKGNGPTVILLHGLFGNISLWMPTVEQLQPTHRVIIPRFPIFDLLIAQTNISYLVRLLHEFIEWHQLSDVTLIGHAVGGQVALFYANQHPDKVERLVLVSSTGLFDQNLTEDSDSSSPSSFDFIHRKVRSAFHENEMIADEFATEIYQLVQNLPKRLALTSLIQSSRHSKVSSFIGRIDLPVLLVWGLQDKISPPGVALHFHDLLKKAEVKFIDQCGHVPMIEKPQEFIKHVKFFLNGK